MHFLARRFTHSNHSIPLWQTSPSRFGIWEGLLFVASRLHHPDARTFGACYAIMTTGIRNYEFPGFENWNSFGVASETPQETTVQSAVEYPIGTWSLQKNYTGTSRVKQLFAIPMK